MDELYSAMILKNGMNSTMILISIWFHELLGSSKLALKAVGQRSATSNEVNGVSKRETIYELLDNI